MPSLNRFQLLGRLTSSPVLRKTSNGKPVGNIRIAINNGETSTFLTVVVWDKIAENCMAYLQKGSLVYVEGHLRERKRSDADCVVIEAVCQNIQFLERRRPQEREE